MKFNATISIQQSKKLHEQNDDLNIASIAFMNDLYIRYMYQISDHYLQSTTITMPPKKKKMGQQLEKMLLQQVPETPVPQPYFSIPSPEPYRFPLSETLLEGIKLLEHYEPDEVNHKIRSKFPNQRVERMIRYKQNFCMIGKGGNGLLINDTFMDVRGVTAFAYGATHILIAYEDLRLEVYNPQLRLIKVLKNFSNKKIMFLKILNVPKGYEGIIILAAEGRKLHVHRIQKSLFSTLSCKFTKEVIASLQYPVTQITEIPNIFKVYLRKDVEYRDCSLVCVSAVNRVYILKVNHFRLSLDDFITIDHVRHHEDITINTVSWGEADVDAPSRFIHGDKLVLIYTFGNQVYFLALREIDKFISGQVVIKCQWVESHSLTVVQGQVAFCQYMKKNQVLLITQKNQVIIFHTRKFDIFEKPISTSQIEKIIQKGEGNLEARMIGVIPVKRQPSLSMETRDQSGLTEYEREIVAQHPLITYADTFEYEYPSNQIFYLTEKKFGIYHYCDWRVITKLMKVQHKYECAMLFLIAIYKKANKFDLGVQDCEAELSETIQMLAIQYIHKRIQPMKSMPEIINWITEKEDYFKIIVTPIEFLTETGEFIFLFDIAKDKIISALTIDDSEAAYLTAQRIFYEALTKFIEHGRIKLIPDDQLKITLKYFTENDNLGLVDRLAIYFDLNKIDRNILIQCLLNNNLVVSLAHVCTQGNQSEFVTPFVKFWGISENYKRQKNQQYAAMFAIRALWYVQLCLQRNWALKEYSFDRYAEMIRILSQHFLTQRIITGLLQVKTEYCLETLGFYFTIQNSQIIADTTKIVLKLGNIKPANWVMERQGYQQLELLLVAIQGYLSVALKNQVKALILFDLFLSTIIIYKTVKFHEDKYLDILISLIENHQIIESMKYGLEERNIENFKAQYFGESEKDLNRILAARYINKILTLVCYQCYAFISNKFPILLSKASEHRLTDLQAEISFLQGNFKKCIEYYMRAQGPARLLVFQFLQNTFKRLNLQKRKEDKKKLAGCITQNIKWMVNLDPRKTIDIIKNFIQDVQEQLIDALKDDQGLQLQFFEGIIDDENSVQMKQKLSDRSISRYVYLMAKTKPRELLDAFKKNPRFTTEQTLKICQENRVYDCMEYLYERMGNINASVKIAALRIDQIMQRIKNGLDALQDSGTGHMKIKQIMENVIDVCRKNHSEQIWESLLDSFIDLYHKYQDSDLPQNDINVLFQINALVMQNLATYCPIEHTIDLLNNKYKDLNMDGNMSKAFADTLSDLSHSINILYIATNLISVSLHHIQQSDLESKMHCYSTSSICTACKFGIIKRDKSIHFRCGHAYHLQCIVSKESCVCVYCLQHQTDQFEYYLSTLNPQHPKIKKVNELFDKFQHKKMEMNQVFKIEEYEKIQKKEENVLTEINKKKKNNLEIFDQNVNQIEVGNRRVLQGLMF